MAKKTNLLKNLLTTASALAVLAGGVQSAAAAERTTGGAEQTSVAGTWGTVPVNGDGIKLGGAHTINFNSGNTQFFVGVDRNGQAAADLTISEDVIIGNIYNGNRSDIIFGAAKELTLAGGIFVNRDQAANYSAVNAINFGGGLAPILTIDTTAARTALAAGAGNDVAAGTRGTIGAIGLSDALNVVTNAANATLNVRTDLKTFDNSWGTIGTINIGTNADAATFEMGDGTGVNKLAKTINFLHNNSVLTLKGTVTANSFAVADNKAIGGAVDLKGKVSIGSIANSVTFNQVAAGVANQIGSLGADSTHRLQTLSGFGDKNITFGVPIFAKTIEFSGLTGAVDVIFNKSVVGDVGSTLTFTTNNNNIEINGIKGSGNADVTNQIGTIDFANLDKTLKIADNVKLSALVTNSDGGNGGDKGTVSFIGSSTFEGKFNNIKLITAGAVGAVVVLKPYGGDSNFVDLQTADAGGKIVFADGFNVAAVGAIGNSGSINQGGGNNGILMFSGGDVTGSTIGGNIGVNSALTTINIGSNAIGAGAIPYISDGTAGKLIVTGVTKAATINVGGAGAGAGAQVGGAGTAVFTDAVTATDVYVGGNGNGGTGGNGNVTYGANSNTATTFRTVDSAVTLNNNVVHTGDIDNTSGVNLANGGAGTLTFEQIGGVVGAIGNANALKEIVTGAGAVDLGGANVVKAHKISINGVGVVTRGNANTTVGTFVNNGGIIFGAEGLAKFVTGATGGGVGDGVTGDVNFNGYDGTLEITAGSTIAGNVDNNGKGLPGTELLANKGTIKFLGAGSVVGSIGLTKPIKAITNLGAGAVGLGNGGATVINAETVSFVGGGNVATLTAPLTVSSDSSKGLIFANSNNLMTTDKSVTGFINFTDKDATLTLTGTDDDGILNANMKSITAPHGNILFTGANATLTGGTDSTGTGLLNVKIGNAGPTTLGFGAENQTYKSTAFEFGDAASVLNLNQAGTTLIGNIVGVVAQTGDLLVNEDATIIGKVGQVTPVGGVKFASPKILTVKSTAGNTGLIETLDTQAGATNAIQFTTDGTLKIIATDQQNQKITAKILNPTADSQAGTIILDASIGAGKTVTFDRLVGDNATTASIRSLQIDAAVGSGVLTNFVEFSDHVNIAEIKAGGATNLKFTKNAGIYKIGNISGLDENSDNTNVNLMVNESISLVPTGLTPVSYGSADKRLGKVKFLGGHELNIGDGVSIYGSTVTSDAAVIAGQGVITFKGNSTFDLKADVGSPLQTIKGPIADKEAVFVGEAFFKGGAGVVVGAGTMSFGGNITMTETAPAAEAKDAIYAAADNTGTLKFTNQANAVVDIRVTNGQVGANPLVGAAGLIKNVEFNGAGDVTFNKLFMMSAAATPDSGLKFTNADDKNPTTVTFKDATTDIGNMNVNVTTAGAAPTINIKNAGDAGTEFKNIITGEKGVTYNLTETGSANIKISSTTTGGASFTAAATNVHNMEMNNNGASIKNLGGDGKNFALLKFTENGAISGNAYVENVSVAANKTATFEGVLSNNNNITLDGLNSKVVFNKDGFILEGEVKAAIAGKGDLEFAGSATVNQLIGNTKRLASVNFKGVDASKVVNLNNDIGATEIKFNGSQVNVKKGLKLSGDTTLTNVDLGKNELNIDNNSKLTLTGDVQLETIVSLENNGNIVGGNIDITGNSKADYSGITTAVVKIKRDEKLDSLKGDGKIFTLIYSESGEFADDGRPTKDIKITAESTNDTFIKWELVDNGAKPIVSLKLKDISTNVLSTALEGTSSEDKANIEVFKESEGYFKELSAMNPDTQRDSAVRVVGTDPTVAISNFTGEIANSMSSHVSNLAGIQAPSTSQRVVDSGAYIGMAAGDDVQRYGAWAAPFFSKSVQKARGNAAGYSAQSGGGSFGFDVKANDDMIVGMALSMVNTDVKHKNYKSGDKTRIESLMLSIYGMQQITENWFGQAVATFGSNSVTSAEKRINSNTTSQTAAGKYTSMSFAGEALLGYNFSNDMFSVTPMGGLRATRINDGGYDETGTTNQNLHVTKKASNKFEVVLGARVAAGKFDANGLVITPEVHAFVNQDLVGKNAQISMKLPGAVDSLNAKRAKPSKTMFNIGAGVNAAYNMMEYGFGYDANISKKYVGHQGTLKVRVNF